MVLGVGTLQAQQCCGLIEAPLPQLQVMRKGVFSFRLFCLVFRFADPDTERRNEVTDFTVFELLTTMRTGNACHVKQVTFHFL